MFRDGLRLKSSERSLYEITVVCDTVYNSLNLFPCERKVKQRALISREIEAKPYNLIVYNINFVDRLVVLRDFYINSMLYMKD